MRLHRRWPFKKPRGWYQLIFIEDGTHTLELPDGSKTCPPGTMTFLQPGHSLIGRAAPGTRAATLGFTVMACEMKPDPRPKDGKIFKPDAAHQQPDASAIWDIDVPLFLDTTLADQLTPVFHSIVTTWWQGERQRFRANRNLALLLDQSNLFTAKMKPNPHRYGLIG